MLRAMDDGPKTEDLQRLWDQLEHVRCAELVGWLEAGRACSILDVRTVPEWESHRIPGATLVPLHELDARLDEVLALPGPLVVHCEHGVRSVEAALALLWHGRRDVLNLREGIAAWSGPLEHGPAR
jgi:adenylyltransferase/sulfurtransferase